MEVRYEFLMPREADARIADCPTLFLPLGTVEWHGLHNVLGVDAVKAHVLCVQASERGGGIVHPPVYGGMGGLDQPHTFVLEPENALVSKVFRPWLEKLCREAGRQGFKAVIILTGHYGAAQQIAVRETAVAMSRELDIPILGTPEYFLALDEEYYGDHAAFFETSIMMYLYPGKVDVTRLGEPPYQGVGGRDPKKFANARDGERFCEAIIGRLARLAKVMPAWDAKTRQRFIDAENALVTRQRELAANGDRIWTAWQKLGKGVFDTYPELLTSGYFEKIQALTQSL